MNHRYRQPEQKSPSSHSCHHMETYKKQFCKHMLPLFVFSYTVVSDWSTLTFYECSIWMPKDKGHRSRSGSRGPEINKCDDVFSIIWPRLPQFCARMFTAWRMCAKHKQALPISHSHCYVCLCAVTVTLSEGTKGPSAATTKTSTELCQPTVMKDSSMLQTWIGFLAVVAPQKSESCANSLCWQLWCPKFLCAI